MRQPHACRPVSTEHVLTMSVRLMIVAGQVVRSSLVNDKGKEVVVFWYLESVELPQKPGSMFGVCTDPAPSLLPQDNGANAVSISCLPLKPADKCSPLCCLQARARGSGSPGTRRE